MRNVRRYLFLAMTVMLAAGIAGCTQNKANTEADDKSASSRDELQVKEDEGIYQSTIEEIDFADGGRGYTTSKCVAGDKIYYFHLKWDENTESYKGLVYPFDKKIGEPAGEEFAIRDGDHELNVSYLSPHGTDGFIFATSSYKDNNPERPLYCVYTCSLDGTVTNKKQLSEIPQISEYSSIYGGIISDGTNIFILLDDKMVMLDEKLRYKKTIAEGRNLRGCLGNDGLIYFISDFSGNISSYDPVSDKLTESVATIASAISLYPGGDFEILVDSGDSVKSFNTVTKETVRLFDFIDANIGSYLVEQIYRDGDENIHIHFNEFKNVERDDGMGGIGVYSTVVPYEAVVRRFEPGSVPEPEIIWLACRYSSPELRNTVIDYNKAHPDIKVKIKEYSDEYADQKVFEEAYDRDLINGAVYDVIMFDIGTETDKYTEKGLIEDLIPYIENDPSFDVNDYFENILFAEKEGDKLYSIVSGATLEGFVGNFDVFGDREKLTMDDIYKEREKRPTIPFMQYGTDMNVLFTFLNDDYRMFLGGEKDVYNFETEEFRKLCEYAGTFRRSADEFIPVYGYSAIAEGTEVVGFSYYYHVEEYLYERAKYAKNVRAYGGPSFEGNGYYIAPSKRYSLSSLSTHKEAAWDLIKCFLNMSSDHGYGFKAYRKAFNEELDTMYQRCKDGYSVAMGDERYYLSMDKADYETFTKMMEGATAVCRPSPVIRQIVSDEIPAYFKKEKSLDEVINIIQSRVNLYLEEKK